MSLVQYSIIQQLGTQRKFSRIDLALNQKGERVILKSCKKLLTNAIAQERLRKEASFTFNSNGLPQVIELIETDTEITLVKKYEEGIDLLSYVTSFPRRKRAKELLLCLEKLQPLLHTIHTQSIVHLDIKPSNIVVNKANDQFQVSIIDFGLATQKRYLETRKTLFPLGFAAPELILNRLHLVDHRTDYFALGICCWNCITGHLPLKHSNPSIMTNMQLNLQLPEERGINKLELKLLNQLSYKHPFAKPPNMYSTEEMDTFLTQAMENRYDSLLDFINDWKQIQAKKNWLGC